MAYVLRCFDGYLRSIPAADIHCIATVFTYLFICTHVCVMKPHACACVICFHPATRHVQWEELLPTKFSREATDKGFQTIRQLWRSLKNSMRVHDVNLLFKLCTYICFYNLIIWYHMIALNEIVRFQGIYTVTIYTVTIYSITMWYGVIHQRVRSIV